MTDSTNPMEILKVLDKSNCGDCGMPTCLAFAATVARGTKSILDCPHLDEDIINRFDKKIPKRETMEDDMTKAEKELQLKLRTIDLTESAIRSGGAFSKGKLTIKVCGKNFSVDSNGNFYSEIHIHTWLTIPVLNYIIYGAGVTLSGNWVPMRELKKGKDWAPLFGQTCEKPMKKVADKYPNLFEDMLHIFNGKEVEKQYQSDISLVLYPLPKFPILICYWKPGDGLDSDLHIFFDADSEKNLNIESIYSLGTGLTTMFEKISLRHGYA